MHVSMYVRMYACRYVCMHVGVQPELPHSLTSPSSLSPSFQLRTACATVCVCTRAGVWMREFTESVREL